MATSPVRLPASNPGGNNQTTPPGLGTMSGTTPPIPFTAQAQGTNPLVSTTGGTALPQAQTTNSNTGAGNASTGTGTPSDSLYNPASSYSNGESNIEKQLIDIYGKGVGGELAYLLQSMSGDDSAIFQQWLSSMAPVEASETAQLQGTLGSQGVSANSSVSAIANSNLQSQFNAQAADEDSSLMTQQLQDTIGILQGTQGAAQKEVASSGWDVLGTVLSGLSGDVGNIASAFSGSGGGGGGGSAAPTVGTSNSSGFAAVQAGQLPSSAPGSDFSPTWNEGADQIDTSIFNSSPADVQFMF